MRHPLAISLPLALAVALGPALGHAAPDDDEVSIEPPPIPTTPLPEEQEEKKADDAPTEPPDVLAARELERQAQDLLEEGRYAEALATFEKAEATHKNPAHELGACRALAKLGRLLEARTRLRKLDEYEPPKDAPAAVVLLDTAIRDTLKVVELRIPRMKIVPKAKPGAKVVVKLDGAVVDAAKLGAPIELDPGAHVVEIDADGAKTTKNAKLLPGRTKELVVDLRPPPGFDLRQLAPYALGVGAAGVVAGGVLGGLSLAKVKDVASRCLDHRCPPDDEPNAATARELGTGSTVAFVAGGAFLAAGVGLLFAPRATAPAQEADKPTAPPPKRASLHVVVGPSGVGVKGGF